jgi:hypothetical protein
MGRSCLALALRVNPELVPVGSLPIGMTRYCGLEPRASYRQANAECSKALYLLRFVHALDRKHPVKAAG